MSHVHELEETFNPKIAEALARATLHAPYPQLLGFEVVEQRAGHLRARLPVTDRLKNGVGIVHGGAISSLADHVLSIVVYPHVPAGKWCATLGLELSYVAPVSDGVIEAVAEIVSLRRRIAHVRVEVTNGERLVATGKGTIYVRDAPGAK